MTNEERRAALNLARRKTLEYAEAADRFPVVDMSGEASPRELMARREHVMHQATMWADVANAMKDGDPLHDAPDGRPAGVTTREAMDNRSKFTTTHLGLDDARPHR